MTIEKFLVPAPLLSAIDGAISKGHLQQKDRARAVVVCNAVYLSFMRGSTPLSSYKPFARNYWLKILGSAKHYRIITGLKNAGILQPRVKVDPETGKKSFYQPPVRRDGKIISTGTCGHYRFDPEAIAGPLTCTEIQIRRRKQPKGLREASPLIEQARKMLQEISLPFQTTEEIEKFVRAYISSDKFKELQQKKGRIEFLQDAEQATLLTESGEAGTIECDTLRAYLRAGLELIKFVPNKKNAPAKVYCTTWEILSQQVFLQSYTWMLTALNNPDATTLLRNETNNRLHSILSQIHSEFLGLITVRNEKLVSIDLRNSQPVLLAALIEESLNDSNTITNESKDFFGPRNVKSSKKPKENSKPTGDNPIPSQESRKHHRENTTKPHLCYLKSYFDRQDAESQGSKPVQKRENFESFKQYLRQFCALAQSGRLYDWMAEKMYPHSPDRAAARNKAKAAFFAVIFDKYNSSKEEKADMREVLPELVTLTDHFKKAAYNDLKQAYRDNPRKFLYEHAERIEGIKSKLQARRQPAKMAHILFQMGNNLLSVALTQIESKIFVDGAFNKATRRGIWVASKHDSLLCLESDHSRVKKILQRELDKHIGKNKYLLKSECYTTSADGMPQIQDFENEPK